MHEDAVELLLASISKDRGTGFKHSFEFGPPGAQPWQKGLVIEIYYRPNKLIRAVLRVRQSGPAYLRLISIKEVQRMLQKFVLQNFGYLMDDVFLRKFEGSFADQVSQAAKSRFADALASSSIFQPDSELTLFPLATVQVQTDFDSQVFFLAAPSSLDAAKLPPGVGVQSIVPELFPPVSDWQGRHERPTAWLGVWSPAYQASNKMKAAILGALALTPLKPYRHMFSGRQVFGGHCTFGRRTTTWGFGAAHTPPLMHNIIVTSSDHAWLTILSSKLTSGKKSVRRQIRALEYFYRAWELDPSERFPILCMSLDALFGAQKGMTTAAAIAGIQSLLGNIRLERLESLFRLRGNVIHGHAPDVYDSSEYSLYYDSYQVDPIDDLELLVGSCLRAQIFGSALGEHSDPNAEMIATAQAKGHLPQDLSSGTILDDVLP